jgi:Flp pilus assembly protein TadD
MGIRNRVLLLSVGFAGLAFAAPAYAQSDPAVEIDQVIQASQGVGPGMDYARRQIAEDDLIGAAATLERLLMDHPEADDALLLHASLLCRLDDVPGARMEIDQLKGVRGSDAAWAEVRAACGPVNRPSGRN